MAPADFESTLLEREKAVHAAPYQPVGPTQACMDIIVNTLINIKCIYRVTCMYFSILDIRRGVGIGVCKNKNLGS